MRGRCISQKPLLYNQIIEYKPKKPYIMKTIFFLFSLVVAVATIIALAIVSALIAAFIPESQIGFGWYFLITITVLITVLITAIVKGWTTVPENHEYIVEFLGDYIDRPLEAGPHILFPWFGFVKIRPKQFLGTRTTPLYLDEQQDKSYGGGSLEFKDCSAPIIAFVYWNVFDSAKATYNIDKLEHAIEELTDHMLRSFFGVYTIDQAIELKIKCNIKEVACLVDLNANPNYVVTDDEFYNSHYCTTLRDWGVEPTNLAVSDIKLPPEIEAGRQKLFTAEQERQAAEKDKATALVKASQREEVAVVNKRTAIIDAEAIKEASKLVGEGEGQRIAKIASETGMTVQDAAHYFALINKWQKVGEMKENPNFSLIEGGGELATIGAAIGTGMNTTKNKP